MHIGGKPKNDLVVQAVCLAKRDAVPHERHLLYQDGYDPCIHCPSSLGALGNRFYAKKQEKNRKEDEFFHNDGNLWSIDDGEVGRVVARHIKL
jgi:hypothetical protein